MKTISANQDINLGGADAAGVLGISATELGYFNQTTNSGWQLIAHGDIIAGSIGGGYYLTGRASGANIVLNSDSDANNGGGITLNSGAGLDSNGGNITLGGGADPTTTAAIV